MRTAPTFADWLAERLGTRQWVVAPRLTNLLRGRGYDVALTPKRWAALETEYNTLLTAAKVERIAARLGSTFDAVRAALAAENLI